MKSLGLSCHTCKSYECSLSILQVESEGLLAHQEEMYLYGCQVLLLWRRRLMDKPQPVGVSRVAGVQDIQHVPFAATDLERKQSQWQFVNDRFLWSHSFFFFVLAGRPVSTQIKVGLPFLFLSFIFDYLARSDLCGDSNVATVDKHLTAFIPCWLLATLMRRDRLMDVEYNQIWSRITGPKKWERVGW